MQQLVLIIEKLLTELETRDLLGISLSSLRSVIRNEFRRNSSNCATMLKLIKEGFSIELSEKTNSFTSEFVDFNLEEFLVEHKIPNN